MLNTAALVGVALLTLGYRKKEVTLVVGAVLLVLGLVHVL